jgi:sulfoxide reductase heme-binding subunit YedZ
VRAPQGLTIVAQAFAVMAALVSLIAATDGGSEVGVRQVVRSTAQFGVVLFAFAFSASSLRTFWRTPFSAWLLKNRRYVGLSFAAFHSLHLLALATLGVAFPDPFVADLNAITLIGGGVAYGLLFAMVATSNDASVRALGRKRWSQLHRVGSWALWIIFAQSYFGRVPQDLFYLWPSAVLIAALSLRMARTIKQREMVSKPSREATAET